MTIQQQQRQAQHAAAHTLSDPGSTLAARLTARSAHIAVLGLGYAGLPMAVEFAKAGFAVTGIDIDGKRVELVNEGRSPVSDVADTDVANLVEKSQLRASSQFAPLDEADCALICVPTPLTDDGKPDLRFVEAAARSIAARLHPGMLVILQSTCGPGTTRRVVLQTLETGTELQVGRDFFVAFAPERIDPGNRQYSVRNTPKVVGGITPLCTDLACLLLAPVVEHVVRATSPEVAEMSKLVENTFRFINISFINEMAMLCDRMGVSIWEVIDAASTKPFAFMPHYPGPGIGGHCIPVVPFYLEAAAEEYGMVGGLVGAAGLVNAQMPLFVVDKLERLLGHQSRALAESRVLLLGVAYKPNVADTRESPGLRVLALLSERAASVAYHDPYVPTVETGGRVFASLTRQELDRADFDCAVLLTPHSGVDYAQVAQRVNVLLDTRNYLEPSQYAGVIRL